MSSSSLRCRSVVAPALWLLLVLIVSSSWSPTTTTQAASNNVPRIPILARLGKDPDTSLYTITIKNGEHPLVVDLSGPLLWSRCPPEHRTIPCHGNVCQTFNKDIPLSTCTLTAAHTQCDPHDPCPTYPLDPIGHYCEVTDATSFTLSAYGTDGRNPSFPVTFMALGACSTDMLFAKSYPADSWGLAGMSRLPQSLPAQVTSTFKVASQFALCLPRSGATGAAIFGGGPFQLLASPAPVELVAQGLLENQIPFLKHDKNGGYYLHVNGINVNNQPVAFPPGAFDLNASSWWQGGGVILSTILPEMYTPPGKVVSYLTTRSASYTTLRSDIYRPLSDAFDAATRGIPPAPPVEPFKMCYQASALSETRLGYAVASIELLLDNGRTWLIPGSSSLVQVNDNTVCFAFLELTTISSVPGSPAVFFGGYQLEDYLLHFDLDKETFSFTGPLAGIGTSCSNFNFTM